MDSCCGNSNSDLEKLHSKQAKVLKICLAINLLMFFVEIVGGLLSRSTSVIADSADMFADAASYALSLYVVHQGSSWKVRASLAKGVLMILLGILAYAEAIYKMISNVPPIAESMGVIGFAALVANLICLFLLTRHREDDINFKSVWLCSRNDIFANVGVMLAAVLVYYFHSLWPDVFIGLTIATVILKSGWDVTKESFRLIGKASSSSSGAS